MVIETKGNLLTSDCDVICHGANCFNTMGAGIARQISHQFPEAVRADKASGRAGSYMKLGSLSVAYSVNKQKWVINLYTQYQPGRNFDIRALAGALAKLELWAKRSNAKKIGFPLIGCGIGGGSWPQVKILLNNFSNRVEQEVYVYHL